MYEIQKVINGLTAITPDESASIEAHKKMIVCYTDDLEKSDFSEKQITTLEGCGWTWDDSNKWWYIELM